MKDSFEYYRQHPRPCYFCQQLVVPEITNCKNCTKESGDIYDVFTINDPIFIVSFTYKGKFRIWIYPEKTEIYSVANIKLIMTIPGQPFTPANIKQKLSTYLTFS